MDTLSSNGDNNEYNDINNNNDKMEKRVQQCLENVYVETPSKDGVMQKQEFGVEMLNASGYMGIANLADGQIIARNAFFPNNEVVGEPWTFSKSQDINSYITRSPTIASNIKITPYCKVTPPNNGKTTFASQTESDVFSINPTAESPTNADETPPTYLDVVTCCQPYIDSGLRQPIKEDVHHATSTNIENHPLENVVSNNTDSTISDYCAVHNKRDIADDRRYGHDICESENPPDMVNMDDFENISATEYCTNPLQGKSKITYILQTIFMIKYVHAV